MSQINNADGHGAAVPPPPPLSRQLVRYILGFGVSVGVGLAPYLGKLSIPGFSSMLELIPNSIHNTVLPLSAALMGLVAVVVQWYGGERLGRQWLKKAFKNTLKLTVLSFIILFVVHVFVVVKYPFDGGSETFLIGFVRPVKPPCSAEMSDDQCIDAVGPRAQEIESHWGSLQIRLAKLALIIPYLAFTGSFGLLVGLLLLRDRLPEVQRNRRNDNEPAN